MNSLSTERTRWEVNVQKLQKDSVNLLGDLVISAAFISYIGAFETSYREKLLALWIDMIENKK